MRKRLVAAGCVMQGIGGAKPRVPTDGTDDAEIRRLFRFVPMNSLLFSPKMLRGMGLANRIVIAPMCQYSASEGCASDWHFMHLGHLALSGAGWMITEATAVEADGRITPACLGLYSDANEAALARIIRFVREHSPIKLAVQLSHAGRKGSSKLPWQGGSLLAAGAGGWPTVSASAVPQLPGEVAPVALDDAGLARVRHAFVAAAGRAHRAGFDAIELHAAHGYLLHQFLSPLSNQRADRYGGTLQNRMRFPLEIFKVVRDAWPHDKPLGVRISATDWVEGGWDTDQSVEFASCLRACGCDFVDVSSGGISPAQRISTGPGYQVPFAERVRAAGMPTIAVGEITQPRQAEDILQRGQADFIALARGILAEPRWPWRAASDLGGRVVPPRQYHRKPARGQPSIFDAPDPAFR